MKAGADAGLDSQSKVKKTAMSRSGVSDSRYTAKHHDKSVKEVCGHCVASMVLALRQPYNLELSFKPFNLSICPQNEVDMMDPAQP